MLRFLAMKKMYLVKTIIFILVIFSTKTNAQGGMLTSFENLIGESSNYYVGLHSGLFDSNQHGGYAFNIGGLIQYNYTPESRTNWFLWNELGAFYVQSKLDDQNRQTKLTIIDLSIIPSIYFPIGAGISIDDNYTLKRKKRLKAKKFKIGLGFTAAIPLYKGSSGSGVNLDAIKPGFGFSLKTSIDLLYNIGLYMSATRVGTDLDGYAYTDDTSTTKSNGNRHNVSYYYKFGLLYRL